MNDPAYIHVLIIVPSLECGGLERNVSTLCNNINGDDFRVTLAVINNANQFYAVSNPAVKLVDLGCRRVRESLQRIRLLVRESKPDLILCTANHLNLFLAIFRKWLPGNIPLIARESSVVSINSRRARWSFIYDRLQKIFFRNLDLIICQSAYMQNDLVKYYHVPYTKTRVIRNSVQVPRYNETGPKSNRVKLLSVGRLSEEKGIDLMLRALALLKTDWHAWIVGDGPEKEKLIRLAGELNIDNRVTFTGSMEHPFTAVDSPSLFLMCSHYEGFPNVLMEANAAGIPVVARLAPGGIGEFVQPGVNGLLAQGSEPKDFAMAMEEALQTAFDRGRIMSDTRRRYDARAVATEWEALFTELAGRRRQ